MSCLSSTAAFTPPGAKPAIDEDSAALTLEDLALQLPEPAVDAPSASQPRHRKNRSQSDDAFALGASKRPTSPLQSLGSPGTVLPPSKAATLFTPTGKRFAVDDSMVPRLRHAKSAPSFSALKESLDSISDVLATLEHSPVRSSTRRVWAQQPPKQAAEDSSPLLGMSRSPTAETKGSTMSPSSSSESRSLPPVVRRSSLSRVEQLRTEFHDNERFAQALAHPLFFAHFLKALKREFAEVGSLCGSSGST